MTLGLDDLQKKDSIIKTDIEVDKKDSKGRSNSTYSKNELTENEKRAAQLKSDGNLALDLFGKNVRIDD